MREEAKEDSEELKKTGTCDMFGKVFVTCSEAMSFVGLYQETTLLAVANTAEFDEGPALCHWYNLKKFQQSAASL